MKTPAELNREISEFLEIPATSPKKITQRRGVITEEQIRSLPRFEFIARWLVSMTRKKENRALVGGYRVTHTGGVYKVISPIAGGTVAYQTEDPSLLFDYVRRGALGYFTREADNVRVEALTRAAR